MSCTLEFPESSVKIDFCSKGNKQKILIDVLTKYDDMDINKLASVLEVPVKKPHDISVTQAYVSKIENQKKVTAKMMQKVTKAIAEK